MSEAKQELISSLQSQLEALQNRVKELEADNAKLLSKLSLCRCEKIEDKVHDGVEDGTTLVEENRKTESGGCKTGKKKVKEKMSGTLNHHFKRYVALKVMYFGQRFYGFASDGNMEPTVESEIFKALEKTRLLVADKKESHYSRCGRTDKGVSSVGQAMESAGKKFVGEHDFRNFCKMDAANVHNYKRHVTSFEISPCYISFEGNQLCAIKIRGSAFLWHQVRCMVAVLFMIGQGLESIDVIESLLDTNGIPRKPQYNMAPEIPLVLQSCDFDGLKFTCSLDQNSLRNGMVKKKASHIPLFSRPTERKFLHTLSTHVIMPILKVFA
ncbi:PseudoU synth 1 domain-containing protein [Citrus sinensis]|nr:PseudoU synth 1 domain-containing protein [Citrus sinensis]